MSSSSVRLAVIARRRPPTLAMQKRLLRLFSRMSSDERDDVLVIAERFLSAERLSASASSRQSLRAVERHAPAV